MSGYQQNGYDGNAQRAYRYGGGNGAGGRGVYGNLNNPYGVGRGLNSNYGGGARGYQNQYERQYQRYPNDYYEDEEEKEEFQRLMINLRKIVVPQLEQVLSYIIIPMIGAWVFKKINCKAPVLPSVINISFCSICKVPVDFWQNPFVKV